MSDTKRNRKPNRNPNRKISTEVVTKLTPIGDCWYDGMNHMQMFGELISRGPTMHGAPQRKTKKNH